MGKVWQKIDQNINRAGSWATFLGLVSMSMSWVAAHITLFYKYGWGAAVFAGVGLTCIVMLVISGCLVAWRYFNPLPKQSATLNDHKAMLIAKFSKKNLPTAGRRRHLGKPLYFHLFE
jgi:hypothetical protein